MCLIEWNLNRHSLRFAQRAVIQPTRSWSSCWFFQHFSPGFGWLDAEKPEEENSRNRNRKVWVRNKQPFVLKFVSDFGWSFFLCVCSAVFCFLWAAEKCHFCLHAEAAHRKSWTFRFGKSWCLDFISQNSSLNLTSWYKVYYVNYQDQRQCSDIICDYIQNKKIARIQICSKAQDIQMIRQSSLIVYILLLTPHVPCDLPAQVGGLDVTASRSPNPFGPAAQSILGILWALFLPFYEQMRCPSCHEGVINCHQLSSISSLSSYC